MSSSQRRKNEQFGLFLWIKRTEGSKEGERGRPPKGHDDQWKGGKEGRKEKEEREHDYWQGCALFCPIAKGHRRE